MTTHLVIPDQHAHPDHSNVRFDWLGKLILDLKPDKIINLGDGPDMESLCFYDNDKSDFHLRRYKKDVDSWLEAQDRIWAPTRKAKKKKPYSIYTTGNHEARISKAIDRDKVMLEGTISMDDLELEKNWDKVFPFLEIAQEDGVSYAHYFTSGVMGRPVSGMHPAASLITKQFTSCTAGHAHTMDYAMRTDAQGNHVMGLVAGVFQDYIAEWAGPANALWWRGLVIKRNVEGGTYDPQFVSMEALRKEYA